MAMTIIPISPFIIINGNCSRTYLGTKTVGSIIGTVTQKTSLAATDMETAVDLLKKETVSVDIQ
jgi:hypothetical protein